MMRKSGKPDLRGDFAHAVSVEQRAFAHPTIQDVDGRDEPGHDECR
jgi:hypothetical protein